MIDRKQFASACKALSDENRIHILEMLAGGELCACKLLEELNCSQPTLSHHMKILMDSGFVNGRKDGVKMMYSLSQDIHEYKEYIHYLLNK